LIEGAKDDVERNKKITAAYASMYLSKSKLGNEGVFSWAGLAAFASHEVGSGIALAREEKRLATKQMPQLGWWNVLDFGALKAVQQKARYAEDSLAEGNLAVFKDIYWMFLAYRKGGWDEIKGLKTGMPTPLYNAWQQIAEGDQLISDGKEKEGRAKIKAGAHDILRYEQKDLLQKVYDEYPDTLERAGDVILNPVPQITARKQCWSFRRYSPNGNLTKFDDRWEWVEQAIFEDWDYVSHAEPGILERRLKEFIEAGK
jgi:hypothetical protein